MGQIMYTLPAGREFERTFFGLPVSWVPSYWAPRLGFDAAIQQVIQDNWAQFAEAQRLGASYVHNPIEPEMGRTPDVWSMVKGYLPEEVDGRNPPLGLYVALGSSLDLHYGVDAFFWWDGCCATVDLSLQEKTKGAQNPKMVLHADMLIGLSILRRGGLNWFGRRMARLLIHRREVLVGTGSRIGKVRWV